MMLEFQVPCPQIRSKMIVWHITIAGDMSAIQGTVLSHGLCIWGIPGPAMVSEEGAAE